MIRTARYAPFGQLRRCGALLMTLLVMPALAASSAEGGEQLTDPLAQATSAPGLAGFLDEQGQLALPAGFSGSLNPAGFELVSGKGEAPRFAPDAAEGSISGDGWTGFGGIGNGCNGQVSAIAVGGAGDVYIGGTFTLCGETPVNFVARFDTTTQTWSSLGSGAANGVNGVLGVSALAVSGSDVYVGGDFTQAGGVVANRVARFNAISQMWASLGSGMSNGVSGQVRALAVSGSNVYVGGAFPEAGGAAASRVARFDTATQTWSSLGSGAANGVNNIVRALAVSGSDVYVGGAFSQAGGASARRVARFDTVTQTWASLGSGVSNGVSDSVNALALLGSDLYAGGIFTEAGGAAANRVARFDTTTQTWSSLGGGAANGVNSTIRALAVSGSNVYVGGDFTQAGGAASNRVARFDAVTLTWASLGSGVSNGVSNSVTTLAVSGSEVYPAGLFLEAGGTAVNRVARFDMGTQTWSRLGSSATNGVNGSVRALAVSGDNVYIGGFFTRAGDAAANSVARFDTTTQTWFSLGSGAANGVNSSVGAIAVLGSNVYVGGGFTEAGGAAANNVARFDTTAQSWSSLGSGVANGLSSSVGALAVSGSYLYVGGDFTEAGGAASNRVARFDAVTQTWASLGIGAANGVNSSVAALAVSGSNVYVGGFFTQAGGAAASGVARFDTLTQTWSSLGDSGEVEPRVRALAVFGDNVFVAGDFVFVKRFDSTTQTWSNLGSGANQPIFALAASGNNVFVGGLFTQAGGAAANHVARFDTATQTWASLGSGVANGMNGWVFTLAVSDNSLFVGGEFGSAGGLASSHIASYNHEVIFGNGFE